MNWKRIVLGGRMAGSVSLFALACTGGDAPPVGEASASSAEPPMAAETAQMDRIGVAMSAAPPAIASAATIMDFDASGNLVELRAGTNGWLCLADDTPAAPGDSPDCVDERWQEWFEAFEERETPRISGLGMAYMLQGSLSPSNTDPFAEAPPAGADWIEDGPHVMVIVPDPAMLDPFTGEHVRGAPYVMYKGTPYAHLMVPVPAP